MFEIIPAIDLRGGKAVRLKQGDFGQEERVADDPVAVAASFASAGVTRLHVVDLDGARTGVPHHSALIREIVSTVPLKVQVGGGIRSVEVADQLLAAGADRLILGTTAVRNTPLLIQLLERFSDRLIIGADMKNGEVAVHGWQETTGEAVADFGRRLVQLGARRFLITDIARDGMLRGVNVEATRDFAVAVGVPVIASGGVRDIDDIKNLLQVQPQGVEGVITGKALYAGTLRLSDALLAAHALV